MLVQRGMKFLAAILPICVAMFVSNLVTVLNYAGLIGFFIAFFFPILLHIRSQWVCVQTFKHISGHHSKLNGYESDKETSPLLGAQGVTPSHDLVSEVLQFLFTTKFSSLYKTPYSMYFSYPIFVLVIAFVSFTTLVFTIVSIAV